MDDKVNKFKVGDEVEVVSLQSTIRYCGVQGCRLMVGSRAVIDKVAGSRVKLNCCRYAYHTNDLKLVNEETNTSQNDSINKGFYSPLNVQQAGDHYKKKGIQPIEYGFANDLSFPQINIVKYVTRHEDKNGLDDLAKSIHYHFFEALRVYGEEGSDELRKKVLKLLEFDEAEQGGL